MSCRSPYTAPAEQNSAIFAGYPTTRWICLLDIANQLQNTLQCDGDGNSTSTDHQDALDFDRLEAELAQMVDIPILPPSAPVTPLVLAAPVAPATPIAQMTALLARDATLDSDFEPTRMQQEAMGLVHPRTTQDVETLRANGSSINYQGNASLPANMSADIPDHANCGFWLTGLPPLTTCAMVLAAVRDIGRVFCVVVNPPERRKNIPTSAAKIVFFELAAAQRFWAWYGPGRTPFIVGGYRATIERNRTRVAESQEPSFCSRVLVVAGPADVVTVAGLLQLFDRKIVYQIDGILVGEVQFWPTGPTRTIEVRFGSFRYQAQTAYGMLKGQPGLRVAYGRDPCDRN